MYYLYIMQAQSVNSTPRMYVHVFTVGCCPNFVFVNSHTIPYISDRYNVINMQEKLTQ